MVLDFGCNLSAEEKKKVTEFHNLRQVKKKDIVLLLCFFPPNPECFLSLLNY